MKRWVAVFIGLIIFFAIGFWSGKLIPGNAMENQPGSQEDILAARSYLEASFNDELEVLEKEAQELRTRVETLKQLLQE